MAVFHYRMQNILDIKYKLETQAKTAFGQAAAALAQQEELLGQLKDRQQSYQEHSKELLKADRLDLFAINQCQQAVRAMKEAIRKQQLAVHLAQRNLEDARAKLNQVMTERKTHEKLREKELDEFMRELESQETKVIDELVSYTYQNRQRREEE